MTDKVIRAPFVNGAINAMNDELTDVLYKYQDRLTVAEVIGVLELLKLQIWAELE
jgi:hypothetical protein